MGVKGREETALIQVRGDGGKGKAWSEMVGQINSPCDWMECERRRKRDSEDSSIGRPAGNSKNSLWVLFGLECLRPQGDWDGEPNLRVSTEMAFRALSLNEAARRHCTQREAQGLRQGSPVR